MQQLNVISILQNTEEHQQHVLEVWKGFLECDDASGFDSSSKVIKL